MISFKLSLSTEFDEWMSKWVSCEWMDEAMMDGWMLDRCWMDAGWMEVSLPSSSLTTSHHGTSAPPRKEYPGIEGINAILKKGEISLKYPCFPSYVRVHLAGTSTVPVVMVMVAQSLTALTSHNDRESPLRIYIVSADHALGVSVASVTFNTS